MKYCIKKQIIIILSLLIYFSGLSVKLETASAATSTTVSSIIRNVPSDRGLVVMHTDNGIYLTWKLFTDEDTVFGTAASNVSFNIYRDNTLIATESNTTNYLDNFGTINSEYSVAPVISGTEGVKSSAVNAFGSGSNYFDIPLHKPADVTLEDGKTYSYAPEDASCGDIDGDGQYEIILRWDCNPQDNSISGYSGNVLLDAYKLDGKFLWRIDLGRNIRAGAHYTQFLVYDFDQDGKDEITCKTAPGSKDGKGNYVTAASSIDAITSADNSAVYLNSNGYVLEGPEYFTIFNGTSGAAMDTIYYPIQRISTEVWGDSYGNRCDRYNADVAWLDGKKPYAVYSRGYYYGTNYTGRTGICAMDFDGSKLHCNYIFDTYDTSKISDYKGVYGYTKGNEYYIAQGNHNVTVADVDGDGKDEYLTGAMCMKINSNDKLMPLWCTHKGHGDALHIGEYDPTHPGFEFFTVHEEGIGYDHNEPSVYLDYGMSVIDGATGQIMFHQPDTGDTGRGVMADVGSGGYYQFWGSGTFQANGNNSFVPTTVPNASSNFRIFWNGDLYDDLLDATSITAWDGSQMSTIFNAEGCAITSGTKAVPTLQADLLGDWREEVIYPVIGNNALRVFTTDIYTGYKMKTLMSDSVYRSGVAAEQTSYNQPPHIGYYIKNLNKNEVYEKPTEVSLNATDTAYLNSTAPSTAAADKMYINKNSAGRAPMKFDLSGVDVSSLYSVYLEVYNIQNAISDSTGTITISQIDTNWTNASTNSTFSWTPISTILAQATNKSSMFPVNAYSKIDITDYVRNLKLSSLSSGILGIGISANYTMSTTFAGASSANPPKLVIVPNGRNVGLNFTNSSDNSAVSGLNVNIEGIRTTKYDKKTFITDSNGKISTYLLNGTYLITSNSPDYSEVSEIIMVQDAAVTKSYSLNKFSRNVNNFEITSRSIAYPGVTFDVSSQLYDQYNHALTSGVTYSWSVSNTSMASITSSGALTVNSGAATGTFDVICSATYNGTTITKSQSITVKPKLKDRIPNLYSNGTLKEIPTNVTTIDNRDTVKTPSAGDVATGITAGTICVDFDFKLNDNDVLRWSACGSTREGTLGPEFNFTAFGGHVTVKGGSSANFTTITHSLLKTDTWYKATVSSEVLTSTDGLSKYNPSFNIYIYGIDENGNDSDLLVSATHIDGRNLKSTTANKIFNYIHFYDSTGTPYIDNTYVYQKAPLTGLSLTSAPTKTSYVEGQELDITGLVLAATYETSTRTVIAGYDVSGYDSSVIGTQEVTVTYEDFAVKFNVTVTSKQLTGITVAPPVKTIYSVGKTFDTTGMVVRAFYNNNISQEVTTGYTVTGYNNANLGAQIITVAYIGKTATFLVNVVQKTLIGITVTAPSKTEYKIGDNFDSTGMVVTAVYDDGTLSILSNGYSIQGYNSSILGVHTITVTYGEYSATFSINITLKPCTTLVTNTLTLMNGNISGQIKANINVTQDSDVHAVKAILAIYENGKIIDIQFADVNLQKGDNSIEFTENAAKAASFTTKLFIWDSISTLIPYTDALII